MINSRPVKFAKLVVVCAFVAQGVVAHSENDLLEQLRSDYSALQEARTEFERLESSGGADTVEQTDYAAWIYQLGEQFADSCRSLSQQTSEAIPSDIPCAEFTASYSVAVDIDIEKERTDSEKTAAMVAQFTDSLGEFDEKLLREQDRVKANRPRTTSANAGGAGGSGESGSESDGESESESGEQSSQTPGEAGNAPGAQQSDQQGNDADMGGGQNAPGGQAPARGGNQSHTPDDIPDGSDDDVIARQLREAAEQETDPELKKKLWEEYKRYKEG